MTENTRKTRFRIKVDTNYGRWSVGACLSHWKPETYLYINLFRWTVSIGMLAQEESEDYE